MRLTPEGWWGLAGWVAVGVVLMHGGTSPWIWVPVGLGAIGWAFFCRHPIRRPPSDPDLWVAPADGRVVACEPHPEGGWRVGIFMQVWDVHVNRAPFAGVVIAQVGQRGQFRPAFRAEASRVNEQVHTYIVSDGRSWRLVQTAGILARRIRRWVRPGQRLDRGQPVGMILLGSRVDVFLPPGVIPTVQVGQRVRAGETSIARGEYATQTDAS
jgi:phosphatidylserine decarboxylase